MQARLTARPGGGLRSLGSVAWLAAWLAAAASAAAQAPPVEVSLRLRGPAVIAVLPPAAQLQGAEGADEAVAHVRQALAETRRCLGRKRVVFETVHADRLTILQRPQPQPLSFDDSADGIALVLAEPGRRPRVIDSGVGPSSLPHRLPQAAYEYWRVRACRRD